MTSDHASACPRRETLVREYLSGKCMIRADTLSRMYGFPIVGIHDVWTNGFSGISG